MTRSTLNKVVFPGAFVIFCLWALWGAFPLVSYEANSMDIAAGCDATEDWASLGERGYGYWMQPLTFIIIYFFKWIFPALSSETIYSALTALCCPAFWFLTIKLVSEISRVRPIYVLAALCLMPESYALATYPNSEVFGLAAVAGAMLCAMRHRSLWCGALLCLGVLLRLDVALLYPLLPILFVMGGYTVCRAWILTAWGAAAVLLTVGPLYWLIGASVSETFAVYDWYVPYVSGMTQALAIFGAYGPVSLPLCIGGLVLLWRRGPRLAFLYVLAGILLVHLSEVRFGNTPKHFAPILLVVPAAGAVALSWLRHRCRRPAAIACLAVIIVSQTVGLMPPRRLSSRLAYEDDRSWAITPGIAGLYRSNDEFVPIGGYVAYPFVLHEIKAETARRLETLRYVRASYPDAWLTSPTHEGDIRLLEQGYARRFRLCPDDKMWVVERREKPGADRVAPQGPEDVQLDHYADLLRQAAAIRGAILIPQTEPIYLHHDWVLRQLERRGVIRQVAPHIYLLNP